MPFLTATRVQASVELTSPTTSTHEGLCPSKTGSKRRITSAVWTAWVGAGIAGYGAIYFGFHDIIVHKRVRTRYLPKSEYMKHIIQAHRLHHVVETKDGTVSFGFLWAPKPEDLKAELKRRGHAGVRAPVGTFGDAKVGIEA